MEKKNRKKEKIKRENLDLDEKVYLLIYGKTNCIKNISKIIYDKKSRAVDRVIKKLREDRWIEEIGYKPPIPSSSALPIDGRTVGKYYCAKVQPLLDDILKDLEGENVFLTPEEKAVLKEYLDGKSFRSAIYHRTERNGRIYNKNINFSTVKYDLCYLSTFAAFANNWISTRGFTQDVAINIMTGEMGKVLFLMPPLLWQKLTHLDPYVFGIAYTSFEQVQKTIEKSLGSPLNKYIKKFTVSEIENFKKTKTGTAVILFDSKGDPYLKKTKAKVGSKGR